MPLDSNGKKENGPCIFTVMSAKVLPLSSIVETFATRVKRSAPFHPTMALLYESVNSFIHLFKKGLPGHEQLHEV